MRSPTFRALACASCLLLTSAAACGEEISLEPGPSSVRAAAGVCPE